VHTTTLGAEGCTKTHKNTPHCCTWLRQVIDCSHHESLGSIT